MISNWVKWPTSRYNAQPKFPAVHTPPEYTFEIILFPVSVHPLPALTAKLPVFILAKIVAYVSGIFIFNVAFFPTNHVPGLNRICPSLIQIAFGNSPERKFCVPVSVRSSPVENDIVPSWLLPDILVKKSQVKVDTLLSVTV